jgi:hypothetical protein
MQLVISSTFDEYTTKVLKNRDKSNVVRKRFLQRGPATFVTGPLINLEEKILSFIKCISLLLTSPENTDPE